MKQSEKIRNIAIIAHFERFAYETPFQGFSSRSARNKSVALAALPEENK